MATNVILGYNPNDFFYADALNRGIMPTDANCNDLNIHDQSWDLSCNSWFADNSGNCIKKELCINKEKVEYLLNTENNHSGADEKYSNAKTNYQDVLLNTINLGIGVLFLIIIIFRNRNIK
jgi:hypothetical protein